METSALIAIGAFMLQLTATLGSVVWVVAKVANTTGTLNQTIEHLKTSVEQLAIALEDGREKMNDHHGRLIRIETMLAESVRR